MRHRHGRGRALGRRCRLVTIGRSVIGGGSGVATYDVPVIVRRCVVADAEALTDLHLDVWEDAYSELVPESILVARRGELATRVERWRQIIGSGSGTTLLAEDETANGRLLGFSSTGPGRDDPEPDLPTLELMALYVRADVYGIGVGFRLLQAAIDEAAAYLWVLDGNARAIAFYERQGFRFDGECKVEVVGLERRMMRSPS